MNIYVSQWFSASACSSLWLVHLNQVCYRLLATLPSCPVLFLLEPRTFSVCRIFWRILEAIIINDFLFNFMVYLPFALSLSGGIIYLSCLPPWKLSNVMLVPIHFLWYTSEQKISRHRFALWNQRPVVTWNLHLALGYICLNNWNNF